jgi:hypothetical protein
MSELEDHNDALGTFIFDGLPAWVGPYFTTSRDEETRRKSALLALTMMLFMLYNSFLILSGLIYEGHFFTFLRTLAIVLFITQGSLLYLYHLTHCMFAVGTLFAVVVDLGTLAVCFNFGAVGEYMMWLLYTFPLLFSLFAFILRFRSFVFPPICRSTTPLDTDTWHCTAATCPYCCSTFAAAGRACTGCCSSSAS